MKYIIAVDCEGVACVVGTKGKSLTNSDDFLFSGAEATNETNACIKALFKSGAKEVIVWDCHGNGNNLLYNSLDPRCKIALGSDFKTRFPGLDSSFSGVLMIGYHSMEGTPHGVLAHTYSSKTYKSIKVNKIPAGEIFLDALVAGESGVPLIFLSSDDKACLEISHSMPWVKSVSTKTGFGRNSAVSKHPEAVYKEIYSGVLQAVKDIHLMKPLKLKKPGEIEIKFKTLTSFLKAMLKKRRDWKISGFKTLSKTFHDFRDWEC